MGMYLGQLPPAEIARLKAELAETLIANFCYPRFYDPRTQSLRMRPVDRAKRQEVWLFLSSVDFTSWGRVDLMSPDLQNQIERLFIQFVQRNRSFFGEQGRKRMSDIRMLIGTSASSVVQGLRNHVSGQRQGNPPFGSPRPVVSWNSALVSGRPEPSWEQVAAQTMLLQRQIQEWRGEVKPAAAEGTAPNGSGHRATASRPLSPPTAPAGASPDGARQMATPKPAMVPPGPQVSPRSTTPGTKEQAPLSPAASTVQAAPPSAPPVTPRKSEPLSTPVAPGKSRPLRVPPAEVREGQSHLSAPAEKVAATATPPASIQARSVVQAVTAPAPGAATGQREASLMMIGEDDIAIFEQLRHQLVVWLRVEAVQAGLEIAGQSPSQLLELLRQHARLEETRLQVVSTLLNLANQVIKTGLVSVIDYKQALMFYLMHTKR